MARTLTPQLAEEYSSLFAAMTLRPQRVDDIKAIHAMMKSVNRVPAYRRVEAVTRVPWFVVGIIHSLEASLRMDRHLHNGDPLTRPTVHVPAGRPPGASFPCAWDVSAEDALRVHGLDNWTDWTIPGIAFVLERYNGFGYRDRHPHVKSPYLWSFSNIYSKGKYIADGQFSDEAVSQQCGGMALLRYMIDHDPDMSGRLPHVHAPTDGEDARVFPRIEGREDDDSDPVGDQPDAPVPDYPGHCLVNGMEDDPDVGLVQVRLRALGIQTGTLDNDFGDITENAVRLFQARSTNLAGEPLEVDGVVGEETWAALFPASGVRPGGGGTGPSTSLGMAAVTAARGEIGVLEQPIGSNRGPRVNQYIQAAGLDPMLDHYPWCMCFVFWCFRQAAMQLQVNNPCPKNASVHLAWQACQDAPGVRVLSPAAAQRDPSRLRPGMVFFLDTGGGKGHAGIVSAINDGVLQTIEGNTNNNGSREGIGVFRRDSRPIRSITLGFAEF